MLNIPGAHEENYLPFAEWLPDVNEIADRCYIGPQGELMETINNFNSSYRRFFHSHATEDIISITKKFYLKPGVYANVKHVYNNFVNQFGMKPRGLRSLQDRCLNNSYAGRRFWGDLMRVDDQMVRLRNQQMNWLDNTSTVIEYVDSLHEQVEEELDEVHNMYPNLKMELYVVGADDDVINQCKLIIVVQLEDGMMNIKHDGGTFTNIAIDTILLQEKLSLWPHINSHCVGQSRDMPSSSSVIVGDAKAIYKNSYKLKHPFIHRQGHYYNPGRADLGWRGICKGDHQSNWSNALWHLDLKAYAYYFTTWAQNYDMLSTNPLNKPSTMFYGMPNNISQNVIQLPSSHSKERTLDLRSLECQFSHDYMNELAGLIDVGGWTQENYDQDYILNEMTNHCDICILKSTCKTEVKLELYPFVKEMESNWEDSDYHEQGYDNLNDHEFMRQQILMHYAAKQIMESGPHATCFTREDRQQSLTDICFILIDKKIPVYNIDWFYMDMEISVGDTANDKIIELFLFRLQNSDAKLFDYFRDEYCDKIYSCNYEDLCDDDRHCVDDMSDGYLLTDWQRELDRINVEHVSNNEEIVLEEELTAQQRTIRWAAQRGGAVSIT